jgi:hypothetical protein
MAPAHESIMESPTVFVLGAGASNPVGFPLGPGLKSQMLEHLQNAGFRRILHSLGFGDDLISAFENALRYGYHPTIDIFLEKKTNFRAIGAFSIARTLMPFEHHPGNLFPQKDWYGDLFTALDFESEQPDTSLLSIVTLNYDRSFEHFLCKNIDYNCQHERIDFCHEKRRKIEVVHAHGSLGQYPEVPYGINMDDLETLRKAAENIKIVSDRLDDSPDFQKAQEAISKANHIIFLGFGYNERTLSSLMARTNPDGKHFYGTSLGLDESTRARLKEMFEDKMTLGDGQDCLHLLKSIGVTGRQGRAES